MEAGREIEESFQDTMRPDVWALEFCSEKQGFSEVFGLIPTKDLCEDSGCGWIHLGDQ